jgi:hypothetical protein
MNDPKLSRLPFEGDDEADHRLWAALADLPRGEPSDGLRQRFYSGLHGAGAQPWTERLGHWLGLGRNVGWATVAASLVLGFGVAQLIDRPTAGDTRLVALEQNLVQLHRELILDRLQDDSASTRLRGVVDASEVAITDPQVAQALLERASVDRSPSVRSAAIDALGSQLGSGAIGESLMSLLESAQSPIVQLSLADLVLRHGDPQQVRQLKTLADAGRLHPDIVRHIHNALGSQSA